MECHDWTVIEVTTFRLVDYIHFFSILYVQLISIFFFAFALAVGVVCMKTTPSNKVLKRPS